MVTIPTYRQQTYCQPTLSHPQLFEQRTTLECLNLCQVLTHNGEMAKIWEEGKPNHVGKSSKEYLQGDNVRCVLCNCLIRKSIFCALLNKKAQTGLLKPIIRSTVKDGKKSKIAYSKQLC